MADEKDTTYRVTDRRKFNADGTPRDQIHEAAAGTAPGPDESNKTQPDTPATNVVSFPGERERSKAQSVGDAEPAVDEATRQARPAEPMQADRQANSQRNRIEDAYTQARGAQPSEPPDASFLELLNMLGVEAALHLGLIRRQGEEPPPVDLEAARQVIDLIGMLQVKTRGNLTAEEGQLLESVLADLRVQFVAAKQRR